MELFAHGDGVLTITSGGKILANGGDTSTQHAESGGAGSGGAIRLEGGSISIAGTLEAKGGNGLTATPGGGGRIAIKTNGNLTLGTTKLDGYTPGTLHISGATATSTINLSSGTITFDTTHGYWHHTSGVHGTGVIEQKVDNAITYKTSTFTFDSINLASGLTVKLQGENSLILKTQKSWKHNVGTNLNANGGDADSNYPAHYSLIYQGLGRLGGYDGGNKNLSNGYGPGAGKLKGGGVSGNFVGGGAGYGSIGQYHANDNTFGIAYGDSALAHLHGGSGAGAGGNAGGGAGGEPSPSKRTEMVPLPSSPEPPISANGGGVASTTVNGGGGGSGGSIRLAGKSITNSGSIQAKGGTPPSTTSTYDGGIGGGGRVSFSYSGNLDEGNVDVGTGAQQGTKGYNTPPEISSALTASVTYSNINYQKRSATKYDDLVLWYTFDEPDGSTAVDYSSNERNATLKNMSASNRVAGKMGGALSFDTPSTKLTSDPSGQYLDLGTWSFGGAFTLSTWIKADEWRSNGTILSLAGSEIMQLRYKSVNEGKLYFLLNGTAGGLENIDTGSVLDWGKWIHLAITLENGGTNTSTSRVYKNGTLFATATDKTTPDSAMRTPQYIGRSHYNSERYFAGDLDDFRLYNSALSAGDVSNIYAELAAGIHYQAQALNNPTGFSATGLPSGLTIDPTTGAITGHSTSVGDHNITLTASNLSGTSPSKTITITVAAQKPLLTTVEFSPKNTQGVSLWLDASDANTISTGVSTNVSTWTNKIDPDVKMHGATAQPDTGGSINGLNAINFVGVANSYHEGMYARKNTSTAWSPAGTNGAPSGTYDDLIIAFVLKLNGNGWASNFDTFNLGFGKHFFGANNQGIWWQYPTNNVANLHLNLGTSSNVLIFKHSVTENIRQVWLNGTSAGSTSASISAPTISGEFRFPCYDKSGGDYYNLTLGEMIVIKGTLTNNALQEIEGYLGSKWNLTDSLPNNHPYKSSSPIQPKIVTSAVGSNSATATATLLETGGTDTTLEVFYGTADKGETVIGWDSNSSLPDAQNPGDIALGMTGLSASTSYTYRVRASNSAGSVWSDAISFSTGAQLQPPAISASDASNVAGTAATTNGNLLSFDGSTQPTITLYYDTEANTTSGRADPFIPFSLSNTLKIWMDAEDANSFQLSGSNITKWYNKAGNGYIFDQKTGDPSRTVVNGKNVVNFDGNDQLWTNDAFLASNYTVLSVSRLTGGQNARLIASKDNNWLIGYWGGRVDTFFFNGWLNRGGTYNADTNWHLHAVTMNNSDQGNTWVDFVQTTTNGNGADDTSYEPSKISFGANGNLSEASKGEIAELLVFDSVLPTSDRQKIEGYLAHKWGLTNSIPDVHPYKTSSPDSQVPATAVSLGQKPLGTFTGALNSLQAGTTYKYRFAATNPGGTAVSAVKTFTTLGLPKIEIPGATEITKTSATLNAKLTFTNGNDSNVTFYWGDNNGSNNGNHNQWDNPLASSTNQGVGVVGQSISGLTTGTTYYYTAKAVNAQGTAWGNSEDFCARQYGD